MLERVDDFEHEGRVIPASRLGYRITYQFVRRFFGRVFDNPDKVFDTAILRPETQDLDAYADGIEYIVGAQREVARRYFDDGSIERACPPLRALLEIMANGSYEGKTERDPEIRRMFTKEALLESDWYRERLETKQRRDTTLWRRHSEYLEGYLAEAGNQDVAEQLQLESRLRFARDELRRVSASEYLETLVGTLGADPL